jgi:putative membrane protein
MGWGWHGWYMGWMGIFWIALVVGLVWLLFARGSAAGNPPPDGETPEEILKRRYASGEISQEDYQRMLNELHR